MSRNAQFRSPLPPGEVGLSGPGEGPWGRSPSPKRRRPLPAATASDLPRFAGEVTKHAVTKSDSCFSNDADSSVAPSWLALRGADRVDQGQRRGERLLKAGESPAIVALPCHRRQLLDQRDQLLAVRPAAIGGQAGLQQV